MTPDQTLKQLAEMRDATKHALDFLDSLALLLASKDEEIAELKVTRP